ncbi:MAG: putative 4-hydroxybenzoate polyprenyltransferase [Saprospiraceae bacterium]|nr:putative 4-hydroxybenzoate polyprenyltransferase [Saprospiraceae bacterium]
MKDYLSLIKFSHTIFALPFALVGFFLGLEVDSLNPIWPLLLKVIVCMIFARSAAMSFNRYVDRRQDELNPRTSSREIPQGVVPPVNALTFTIVNAILFMGTTYLINPLCFYLSPVALAITLGYSYTKRFTFLCHLILGLGLSLAPIGAYLAVTARFDWIPILFGSAVLFWVAGFDIIYSLQDEIFDRRENLRSIPVWVGSKTALQISKGLHVICAVLIICSLLLSHQLFASLQGLHWIGGGLFLLSLIYQHRLVKYDDLSKLNLAFFTTNGMASVIFAFFFIVDLLW